MYFVMNSLHSPSWSRGKLPFAGGLGMNNFEPPIEFAIAEFVLVTKQLIQQKQDELGVNRCPHVCDIYKCQATIEQVNKFVGTI